MMLQVVFLSCLLFVGSFAGPQLLPDRSFEDSKDLKELLSEVSDAASKLDSLSHKFEEIERSECPRNEEICRSIRKELTKGKRDEKKEVRVINGVLSSIQEKVDRLDRKMESGVVSPMEYVNAMKGLERRLQYFQSAVMELGRGIRVQSRYVEASDDDETSRAPRASRIGYDDDGIKHLGKTCKLLVGPYKKLLNSVDRLEDMVRDLNSKNSTACAFRTQKTSLYKNSAFKDIKEMLEDISDDIKSLRKMSTREMNENEKILKKINKKLEKELKDDDKDDEKLKKSLKGFLVEQRRELEKTIKKAMKSVAEKGPYDDDDDDDDDDTDDTDDSKEKGRRNSDTDDDDDDDDEDNSCDDSDGCRRKKKGKDRSDDDDDDDDDDSDDDKKRGKKKHGKNDDDDDKTDSDDDDDDTDTDTDDDRKKGKGKKNWEKLSRKNFPSDEKKYEDVEVMKNSASGYFGKQKLFAPLFGTAH